MAIFYHIVALLGGLAMFLYGMRVMGDGLKSNSGGTMKAVLSKVTSKPFLGFLLGMIVTCIIQSSTATIVLSVGLVGAGFLTFRQSIGVVLGANVGTAITAQIIRLMDLQSAENSIMYFFKADNLAPMALIIGIVLLMTSKHESRKNLGNVACGFGVLFMGLIFMSDAVAMFEESLSGLLTAFENNAFLGFASGVVVTGVIQSSSAVVGIIQSVASTVGVTFKGVFAVIIGVNIGDCLTTFLVSRIGARPEQIRTAVVHVVYNICAAFLIIVILFIGRTTGLISNDIWSMSLKSGGVANIHGLFRIVPAVILLPFAGVLAKITEKLVPDKEEKVDEEDAKIESDLRALDERLITSPIMALDQVSGLLNQMTDVAYHNFTACGSQIFEFDKDRCNRIDQRENLLDRITDETSRYLLSMTPYIKRDRDFRQQHFQLKTSVNIERIGDHAVDIMHYMKDLTSDGRSFSKAGLAELKIVLDAVDEIITTTFEAYKAKDIDLAQKVEPLEEVIDDLVSEMNSRHIHRMQNQQCDAYQGILFQNILTSMENISDQCSDLAIYVIELAKKDIIGHEHEYIHELHHSDNEEFKKLYQEKRDFYYNQLAKLPALNVQ